MTSTAHPSAEDVRRALRSPSAYPGVVDSVEVIETHISHVYLAGDRVYKVKKPLRLPFLDASTLDRRRELCDQEVRLNRRWAGDVYRGVVEIRAGAGGEVRVGGGDGEVVEVAVEMDRLPGDRMLDRRLERGDVDHEVIDRVVESLVRFHAGAATGPEVDAHGRPDAVAATVAGNLDEWIDAGGVPAPIARHLRAWIERTLRELRPLMQRRVAEGRIREGHGDLHAGNVCLLDESVVAYDCIEFEPAFRCIDVAAEVAFLAMDLASRGFAGFADALARRYAERAEDAELRSLLPLYQVHYAIVRAKVAGLLARDESADEDVRRSAERRARAAAVLAVRLTLPPFLALTCGLPGSGKSTVAREIGSAFEAFVLRSDVERKRLAGVAPTESRRAADRSGIYTPAWNDRVYDHLLERAEERLARGRSVVVDAAFPSAARRAPFVDLARRRHAPLVVIRLDTREEVAGERLRARAADPTEASDAGPAVRDAARARHEPPSEIPARELLVFRDDDALPDLPFRLAEQLVIASSQPPRSPR
ncbi:MAG: AAA family ATPase [Planctomycetota bacterium JB042]